MTDASDFALQASKVELGELDRLIERDYESTQPGETTEDLKRRAAFDHYDLGLYRDWLAAAARRRAACRNPWA